MRLLVTAALVSEHNIVHTRVLYCNKHRIIEPPSAPQSLSLYPTHTNIFVTWSRPSDEGGRTDLYYQVEHSDPENFGSYNGTVYLSSLTHNVTLYGLRPYTQYCVRVIAHNGVSDQDSDRTFLRTAEECVRTNEGSTLLYLLSMYVCVCVKCLCR